MLTSCRVYPYLAHAPVSPASFTNTLCTLVSTVQQVNTELSYCKWLTCQGLDWYPIWVLIVNILINGTGRVYHAIFISLFILYVSLLIFMSLFNRKKISERSFPDLVLSYRQLLVNIF